MSVNPRTKLFRHIAAFAKAKFIRLGNLYLPPDGVYESLHRYTKMLICLNEDRAFPYTLRGSALFFQNNGRYFAAFCKHQIRGYSPQKVAFVPRSGNHKTLILGGTYRFLGDSEANAAEDFSDIVTFEIAPARFDMANLESEFFALNESERWPAETLGNLFVYGYPSDLQNLPLDECADDVRLAAINMKAVVTSAEYIGKTSERWTHEAKMLRTTQFHMDGLSGGPVFHLGRDANGFFIGLAGIVVRGSAEADYFRFVDASRMLAFGRS